MTDDTTTRDDAHTLLRQLSGDNATFRPDQWEAIDGLVNRTEQLLLVQRTGWGKSAVYFIATRILRGRGAGPTLLVSPLLALMRDQVRAAARLGLKAATINSSNTEDWDKIFTDLSMGEIDLLLISPERLNNPAFREKALDRFLTKIGLIVVDEAHCVSDWGHDFRPDYRRIQPVISSLAATVPVLLTTATANDRVIEDIKDQLGDQLEVRRGTLVRDSLSLDVLDLPTSVERLAWLADQIPTFEGSGIVYCLTQGAVASVTEWLQTQGISAVGYTGGTPNDERLVIEQQLLANEVKAVVATSALGMGFDKPDLAWVVHYQSPGSPIAYYQQVGRAGRALDQSAAILLVGQEDLRIQNHFIDRAFPPPEQVDEVLGLVDAADGPIGLRDISSEVNIKWGDLESILKQLDVEGAVKRIKGQSYERTGQPWVYPTERVGNVTEARKFEQQLMLDYAETSGCRMQFLTALLDDPADDPCGICDNCRRAGRLAHGASAIDALVDSGVFAPFDPDPAALERAARFLRNRPIVLGPKKMGIPAQERSEAGLALAIWGDDGWGRDIERGKYRDRRFSDELVAALAEMVRDWAPETPIEWVTAVPSTRSGDLVPDAAARVAASLGLPFFPAVARVAERPPQEDMANSAYQRSNVDGAFGSSGEVPSGPVLLIDDLIDSGWTLTEVGQVLRRLGSGPVFPVALASTPIRN
jgi:ATP-dependent DNA helicase RecQ